MECEPIARFETHSVAVPLERVAVPSKLPSSIKVTIVPVGTAVLGELAVTVAAMPTTWPYTGVVTEALKRVVVAAWLTVIPAATDVLLRDIASPE
jgi:hypothetical protein